MNAKIGTKLSAIWIIILSVLIGNLTSCADYGGIDSQLTGTPALESDALDEYKVLAIDPADIVFNVSANTPWKISVTTDSEDPSWCVVTPAMSSASGLVSEIVVSMETNPNKTKRTATLIITADNIEQPITTKITQDAQGNLHVEGTALSEEFDANAQTAKELIIRSNKSWEIICDEPWVTFSAIDGEASDQLVTLEVTVAANNGLRREASFIVKTGMQEVERIIKQAGFTLDIDEEGQNVLNSLPAQLDEFVEVVVNSNGDWTPETTEDWITDIKREGNKLLIKVDNNYNFGTRSGIITLKGSSIQVEVPVKQLGATLYVWEKGSKTEVELPEGRVTEQGIMLKSSDEFRLAFPGEYMRGTFTWEFEEIAINSPLIIEGAGDYNASVVPNAHIVMNDPGQTFNGPNDFRVNNGSGGWWLTWQQVNVLRNQSALIKKFVLQIDGDGILLSVYGAGDELLASKKFDVATGDDKWIGTDGFGYSLYFRQQLETDEYCILKSFKAEPIE